MRLLPGVVGAAALAAAVALAGCSEFDAALGQRQAVVTFAPGTSLAQRLAIRNACAKTPGVTAQPLPPDLKAPYALQQVTYQVTHASDADVALLETCLSRYRSVVGITLQDASDQGG